MEDRCQTKVRTKLVEEIDPSMPAVSARLLSRERLLRQRSKAERARRACGQPHRVHYFHQVDDPYSALAAAVLPLLAERYAIDIVAHVVGPPPDDAAPDRARLVDYSRRDARLLARHGGPAHAQHRFCRD